jgi:magnesium-protoporphyrin IX monomethyl ester (oxidative) cyclase
MLDDNFFVSKSRVKDLCKRLITEFPDMLFSVPSGTEINALDHEMIDLLAQANFYRLVLAIESANPDIQATQVDKNVKLDRIPELIQYIKSKDIEVKAFFMIGFPDETKESIHATANYALSLDLDDFALSVVTPLPGTPLFDKALAQGQLRDDFNPNDIRYSISSIKIEGMTAEELEDVRKNTWLELQKRKRRGPPKHNARRLFTSAADFATAGFIDKERVGFSGYAYPPKKYMT